EKVLFNIFLNYIDNNEKKKYFFNIKLEEDDFFMLKIIAIDMKIPLNYMHKIFEPFFSTGKGKNFGIGLNEVKKILNMKNCGIHVLNNKNSSEFIIFLPKKLTYQI
ncbi:MAG: hypothetical protein M0Q02_10865, partial [Candidatus Muirbacterium halophilum]|nr:hypothetical protein [Candidatus Muirbacterium halophilum]